MRLFHVSEQPDIAQFIPRPPERADLDQSKRFVWAVNEKCLPNFLTPRDCPRVTYHSTGRTTAADTERFFSSSSCHCVAIERDWHRRILETRLYIYEFDPSNFCLQDEIAGYYVSEKPETPMSKIEIADPLGELLSRNVEVRILCNLWSLADRIMGSTLNWSFCDMANARPRE